MKNRSPRLPEGDDGKTIVNMNVDGMPWYHPASPDSERYLEEEGKSIGGTGHSGTYQMTKEESRAYTWGALKASLLLALVYGLAFFLFILFCVAIWFN